MLKSALGIRLLLWLGKTVPVPAPYSLINTVTQVTVQNDDEDGNGFQITFSMGKVYPDYTLLRDGTLAPYTRVVIGVLIGANLQVLIDGAITHHQVSPGTSPGTSSLTVTGKDISTMLDLEEKNASYQNETDSSYVRRILASYSKLGLVPDGVQDTTDPNKDTQLQTETDLKCIQRLAERNGYVFFIEPASFLVNRAYFGKRPRQGTLLPALAIDMGDATNLTSLHFSQDGTAPIAVTGQFIEPTTGLALPIPPPPLLRLPPFAAQATAARRIKVLRDTANRDLVGAILAAEAEMAAAPDAVVGEGELDGLRYGSVLRARQLVPVRGAGNSYNGTYYVRRVSHTIEMGKYTQSFTISREGTGNILPAVPT